MFRDFFSFAVGAIVALASVMPYEKCMKSFKNNVDSAYAFIVRMDRLAKIEVHTGLDVDWIEATRDWTGLQKECAKTAAETCRKMGGAGINNKKSVDENNYKPLAKVAKQFERNPDLGMDPYNLTKTYLDNMDQIDKKALDSVMEARNAYRTMNQLVEVTEFRPIPGSLNPRPLPIPIPKMVVGVDRLNQSTEQLASDFERRANLVATPDVVERPAPALERLLDEVACELDANPNASIQKNEHGVVSSEALARASEE